MNILALVLLFTLVGPLALLLVVIYRRGLIRLGAANRNRMKDDHRDSFTAELVCAFRAIATGLGWCNDPYAWYLLQWDMKIFVAIVVSLKRTVAPFLSLNLVKFLAARTVFFDSVATEDPNVEQVVILGAGLDARGHRLFNANQNARIFEVDAPASQDRKLQLLHSLPKRKLNMRNDVMYVPVDFTDTSTAFVDELKRHSCNTSGASTVILMEGVASYLSRADLEKTLRLVSESFPTGTRFAMNMIAKENRQSTTSKLLRRFVGEEWRNGWDATGSADDFFNPLGFDVVKAELFDSYVESEARKYGEQYSPGHNYVFVLRVH